MPYCPQCGKSIINGAKFCVHCGTSLKEIWKIVGSAPERNDDETSDSILKDAHAGTIFHEGNTGEAEVENYKTDDKIVTDNEKSNELNYGNDEEDETEEPVDDSEYEKMIDDAYALVSRIDLNEDVPENIVEKASIYAIELKNYNKGNPELFYKLGAVLLRGNRFNSALAMFNKCIKNSPEHTEALRERAITFSSMGDSKNAMRDIDKLCNIDSSQSNLLMKAHLLKDMKLYGKSMEVIDSIISDDDKNIEAWELKGNLLRELGYKDKASKAFDKSIELKLLQGDVDSALEDYNVISEMETGVRLIPKKTETIETPASTLKNKSDDKHDIPEHAVYYRQALAYYYQRNYLDASSFVDKAVTIKKDYIEALVLKGKILEAIEDYRSAAKIYLEVAEMDKNSEKRWKLIFATGNIYVRMGKLREAIKFYDMALKDYPEAYQVWTNKGSVYLNLKSYRNALACYNRALKIKPDDDLARKNRNICLRML